MARRIVERKFQFERMTGKWCKQSETQAMQTVGKSATVREIAKYSSLVANDKRVDMTDNRPLSPHMIYLIAIYSSVLAGAGEPFFFAVLQNRQVFAFLDAFDFVATPNSH